MRALLLATILLCMAAPGASRRKEPAQTGILFRSIKVGDDEHRYAVYVPRDYDPARPWPILVFLNGSGECGADGQKQLAVGLAPAVLAHADRWPFIIIFPQKPVMQTQWEVYDPAVMAILDAAEHEWKIDLSRQYLTGLSQGGHGVWTIAAMHPRRFAAIAPVCGYGDPVTLAGKLKDVPVWAFHGEKDPVVSVAESKALVNAILKAGGAARLTTYPDVEHNAWERAYADPELPAWLLAHQRAKE